MAITIKNNTTKLQNLKNKVNALPDKEEGGGTIVLDQTTVSPADVLATKTYYYADANGQPVKGTGLMNNWGNKIDVKVGLNGTGQDARYGYITGVSASFAEEVNNEIDTQANLIAQIKSVLNNKMAGSGGSADMLQARINATKSCDYLFYQYVGDNVDYIANLDTSNVTSMIHMFNGCSNLTSIPLLDTSKVTNMNGMFNSCSNLTSIPQLDTSKVTNMSFMFNGCSNLTSIPLLDTSKVTNMSFMFNSCSSLKSILMYGMKVNFDISASTQFERSDLVTILNNLATVTNTRTLTMGSTNLAKLTKEDKAIATNKGWTLA